MDINQHIEQDKRILEDPTVSPQMRRHIEGELQSLQNYQQKHPEDIKDPSSLELYCNENPDAPECKVYDS